MGRVRVPEYEAAFAPAAHLSDAQVAIRAVERMAAEARTDLTKFYNFVMRHETTKAALVAAPHQELMFSFVQHHEQCVLRLPVGMGKTFGSAATALFLLGGDVTSRGAMISKAEGQAAKPLNMVADYITEETLNQRVRLVFPNLRPSRRPNDKWTRTEITVDRPPGIRDSSVVAKGSDGAIGGARCSWIIGDDMIDLDNSSTVELRERTRSNIESRIMTRRDPLGSRAIVANTPWDREDYTFYLETVALWPTVTMDIYGFIRFSNADPAWLARAEDELVRPSERRDGYYRLRKRDPDPDEAIPLWPERMPLDRVNKLRREMLPHDFARVYLCEPFDPEAARCQLAWIERCKREGRGLTLVSSYTGRNPVFTGIDLGIGLTASRNRKPDLTSMFTFELLPDSKRRVLDIESGRWTGPEIIDRIISKADAFGSALSVETNQAQDFIRQFAIAKRPDLNLRAHTTTRLNKGSIDFGVESVFTEMRNGAWVIPCDDSGQVDPEVKAWIDEMLFYQPPPHHTGDRLMASWIAKERSRKGAANDPRPMLGKKKITFSYQGGF